MTIAMMNDAELIDRVAECMWSARWASAPFAATFAQGSPQQQGEYRTMARAAIEFILSGEVEGDGLAQRGGTRPVTGLESQPGDKAGIEPGAGEVSAKAHADSPPVARSARTGAGTGKPVADAGRQPSPSTYTPKGMPPVVDPRTPDDWDGGDVPPARGLPLAEHRAGQGSLFDE